MLSKGILRRVLIFMAVAMPAHAADRLVCDVPGITVAAADPDLARHVCKTAAAARRDLAACNLVAADPLRIDVVDRFGTECLGLYHCGEGRIEILSPDALAAIRKPEGAFGMLPVITHFDSVLVHEISHSAMDDMPCPFANCVTAQEYVAYAMQVRSLAPAHRALFETGTEAKRRVGRDEINKMILYMAPGIFARKAWLHFRQRPDPCGFIGGIARGDILLDREHF